MIYIRNHFKRNKSIFSLHLYQKLLELVRIEKALFQVRKLNKKRRKKLRDLARFWLRRAMALMLSNAILAFIIMLIQ